MKKIFSLLFMSILTLSVTAQVKVESNGRMVLDTPTTTTVLIETQKENENKIIRKDRIWEYVKSSISPYNFTFWQMKFDGEVEVNGRVYTIFKPIGGYEIYQEKYLVSEYKIKENSYPQHYALIREENGKVFVYNPSGETATPDYARGDKDEYLLYDFSLKEGDSMPVTFIDQFDFQTDFWKAESSFENISQENYPVTSLKKVNISDEEEESVTINDNPDWEFIGGIGWRKSVLYINLWEYRLTTFGFDVELNNVYDTSGNIIYKGANLSPETWGFNGKKDIEDDNVKLIKNGPELNILCPGEFIVDIYSLTGKKVISQKVIERGVINLTESTSNPLIVVISNEFGTHVRKVIK